jgi:membrane fusion protein, copper/silver efflux system
MKTQFGIFVGLILLAFLGGFVFRGMMGNEIPHSHELKTNAAEEKNPEFYTCSMHPQIKQSTPGKCLLCGMDLVPVFSTGSHNKGASELTMSPRAMKLAEVESVPVERKFVTADVRMVGKVTYDETKRFYLTAWVGGRLDRLFVDYTGLSVSKGDHLVELYSPDLYQAQEELLSAIAASTDMRESKSDYLRGRAEKSIVSAREKLRLWGLEETQIEAIEMRKEPSDRITINSPISGVVVHKNAVEGMYVDTGTQIYTIADLSEVWVKLDAYESDLAWLHYGQEVEFRTEAYPGDVFKGKIAFIDPILNAKTRTVKIRVNLPNPGGKLKPDMFVRAVVKSQVAGGGRIMDSGLAGKWISPMHPEIVKDKPGSCDICGMDLVSVESLGYVAAEKNTAPLVIPASAPLITGKRAVVYIDLGGGRFEGREVVLGSRAGDHYLVESGLKEGERVVTKGNFKIDSAIQILAKPSMMNPREDPVLSQIQDNKGTDPVSMFSDISVELKRQMGELFEQYLEIKDDLSHDRFKESQLRIPRLKGVLESVDLSETSEEARAEGLKALGSMNAGLDLLAEAETVEAGRAGFEVVSNAMIVSVRRFGTDENQAVYVYHCPMAFGGRGGDWLQGSLGTENPYYGSKMFQCGNLAETLSSEPDEHGHEGHRHE